MGEIVGGWVEVYEGEDEREGDEREREGERESRKMSASSPGVDWTIRDEKCIKAVC